MDEECDHSFVRNMRAEGLKGLKVEGSAPSNQPGWLERCNVLVLSCLVPSPHIIPCLLVQGRPNGGSSVQAAAQAVQMLTSAKGLIKQGCAFAKQGLTGPVVRPWSNQALSFEEKSRQKPDDILSEQTVVAVPSFLVTGSAAGSGISSHTKLSRSAPGAQSMQSTSSPDCCYQNLEQWSSGTREA